MMLVENFMLEYNHHCAKIFGGTHKLMQSKSNLCKVNEINAKRT
jgi:hypothetical protein